VTRNDIITSIYANPYKVLKAYRSAMGKNNRITDNEKKLLHVIETHPELSIKELLTHTTYKWERTVKRKLKQLKEQEILSGPFYVLNYSKLSKNSLHKLVCTVETNQSYETVIPYLQIIEPIWVYPVMSPHKKVLTAAFYSTDITAMEDILQLLKDNDIITDYIARVWHSKRLVECANLFGDSNPSLDNLLTPCELPDMSLEYYDIAWNECDLRILPYLEGGEKLIEILRKEKNLHRDWTYEQIKYSRGKMVKNGLIEKKYLYNPFLPEQCAHFQLFLKTDDINVTQRALYNFAKGARVTKQYVLCEDWGKITCVSHPLFLKDLMSKLDSIDAITEREIYPKRAFPPGRYCSGQIPEYKYFNVETQTIEYPYHVYEEKIKERIESEQLVVQESAKKLVVPEKVRIRETEMHT